MCTFVWLTIGQVQIIFTDAKTQGLYNLFRKEGQQPSDEARYREAAVQILGDSEHLFRTETVHGVLFVVNERSSYRVKLQLPHLNVFTVQLLGKGDPSQEDPEFYIDRWRSYITSYTSVSSLLGIAIPTIDRFVTAGNPHEELDGIQTQVSIPPKVGIPLLHSYRIFLQVHRNRAIVPDHPAPAVVAGNALEMKICVRTYHIFYVSNTADFLYRPSPPSQAGIPRRIKGTWFEKLKEKP